MFGNLSKYNLAAITRALTDAKLEFFETRKVLLIPSEIRLPTARVLLCLARIWSLNSAKISQAIRFDYFAASQMKNKK